MDLSADIDVFFADLAVDCTVQNPGEQATTMSVLFNVPAQDLSPLPSGLTIPTTDPTTLARDTDLALHQVIPDVSILTIGGKEYQVTKTDADGAGMTMLTLTEDFDR